MVTTSPLAARIAQEHAAAAATLPDLVISSERRRTAVQELQTHGLPGSRDENWKYTDLRSLEKVSFAPVAGLAAANERIAAGVSPIPSAGHRLPAPIAGYSRYTFVDGVYSPGLSSPGVQQGVSVTSLRLDPGAARSPQMLAARPNDAALSADARFALLNEAFATDGACILVADGVDCDACIEIVFAASAAAHAGGSYPRIELQVGAGARFGLIERHLSLSDEASFVNGVVNIELGRGAILRHYRVQQMGPRSIWFDTSTATLRRDAVYRLFTVDLGASSARSTVNIRLAGEGAETGVFAASVADRDQSHDAFVLVDHLVPRARTEQTFRGVAASHSRIAFNGKVVVRKNAHGTDSTQSLRGLLAGPQAEIDVRPQLEIYTDDVRCAHGATAGKLDENMLFYLLSRGLDRDTAQSLLKWAFLEDVVARIEVPELRRQIEQSLAGQLNETAVLQELL